MITKNKWITEDLAIKILSVVDKGLVNGLGSPTPGAMCVEAAVCYAMGLEHDDQPPCVSSSLRTVKICFNDASGWKSNKARAKGLRRLAVAQLGTNKNFNEKKFIKRMIEMVLEDLIQPELKKNFKNFKSEDRNEISLPLQTFLEVKEIYAILDRYEWWVVSKGAKLYDAIKYILDAEGYYRDDDFDSAASSIIDSATMLLKAPQYNAFAEAIVHILIDLKANGAKFLYLTEKGTN